MIARILSSWTFKLLLALLLLSFMAAQSVPYLIETKPYMTQIAALLREKTGGTFLVKGSSAFQLLPRPALRLQSVELSDPALEDGPVLSASSVELRLDPLSLLLGRPVLSGIQLLDPSLMLTEHEDGAAILGFLNYALLQQASSWRDMRPVELAILGGRIVRSNPKTGYTQSVNSIETVGVIGEKMQLAGVVQWHDQAFRFRASRDGVVGATPLRWELLRGEDHITFEGAFDSTGEHAALSGAFALELADVGPMIGRGPVEGQEYTPQPLRLSATYTQTGDGFKLSGIQLATMESKAEGELEWGAVDARKLALRFSQLDFIAVKQLIVSLIASLSPSEDLREHKMLANPAWNLALDLQAEHVQNGDQAWSHALFDGRLADGVLTVNKLALSLPGDSRVTVFGLVSVSDTQGLRFEGSTEGNGGSLRDLLTVFGPSAVDLPDWGLGAYDLHANLFISKELLRLSEAEVKLSELALKGGLVAYFDKKPRIEADVALRDINFDYFRDHWRKNTPHDTTQRYFLHVDREMNFDWLKQLSASVDFKVQVQNFTFLERAGKTASFRIFAQKGEVGLYNGRFVYDQDTTEGMLKLDMTGAAPNLTLVLNTAVLNTDYFALMPRPPEPDVPPVVLKPKAAEKTSSTEALPEMTMPELSPEEDLRRKIDEEASEMEKQETAPTPANAPGVWNGWGEGWMMREAWAEEPASPATPAMDGPAVPAEISALPTQGVFQGWSNAPIDMSLLDSIDGSFDISVGNLQHHDLLFQNFKMMAKLQEQVLTLKALTFAHWGGSCSINGRIFGGKVPGLSLGFILASVDLKEFLGSMLHTDAIGGRASLSGTLDSSGVNLQSWLAQASAKVQVVVRGMLLRDFDLTGVPSAVLASRTAADVVNNVNLGIAKGQGEYSADGAFTLEKAILSTSGLSLKTGRIVGNVGGEFRLVPWEVNFLGTFKFPELSTENVPMMTVRWSGSAQKPALQTDTQALEAFVSKTITGN